MLVILLLAQTTAASPPEIAVVEPPDVVRFDLAKYRARESNCVDPLPTDGDVLVCARMADMPRNLEEQAALFEPKPFRPAWRMLGGEGDVHVEQRSTLMGSAPAAMVTFKLKF